MTKTLNEIFEIRFCVYKITIANKDDKTIKVISQEFTDFELVSHFAMELHKELKNCIVELQCNERDLSGHFKCRGQMRVNSKMELVSIPYPLCYYELEQKDYKPNDLVLK
jgi:hypothetical protein